MADNTSSSGTNSSADEIKTGEGILEYTLEIGKIQEKLEQAYSNLISCIQNMEREETYQGDAKVEITSFLYSLESNLQKMIFLYQAAASYINNTYMTMYYNEKQLAEWISKQMGDNIETDG